MRKPDDDLKIDILELFGGELPSPSEALSETISEESPQIASSSGPPLELDNQFKEWMDNRNEVLDAKSLELGKKLQDVPLNPTLEVPENETLSIQDIAATPSDEVTSPPPIVDSPIDFSAPIALPFMGKPVEMTENYRSIDPSSAEVGGTPTEENPKNIEDLKKLQAEYEFLMHYDEFRNIIHYELKDLVGEKKTFTMLGRTFELAREKFPEIFRNANWDSSGNLLADGSIESQRLIENKNLLAPARANEVLDAALSLLLKLRLQAVEKGLGAGLKNKIRARMYQWISEKTQKSIKDGNEGMDFKRLSGYVTAT